MLPPEMCKSAERVLVPLTIDSAWSWASTLWVNALCDSPAVVRMDVRGPSPFVPSCRVRMLTTPLIASVPYNAEPCGPRMTSIRSIAPGLNRVTSSGFATSTPSM
jgi:hypothetical protein